MKIHEVFPILEELAPLAYAESFDNVGLLVGNQEDVLSGILVCHDALEEVVEEAISHKCNLIVCFHPILFAPIKKLTGKNYVERAILKAIKNDVAIYAIHTALDNHHKGVNKIFCDALGLVNTKILVPKEKFIKKLEVYTVPENEEQLRNSLFAAGAGRIGNYDNCSFNLTGIGTYQGDENSNPKIGKRGEFKKATEVKISVTFESHLEAPILKTMHANHIYEEVAYELYELLNEHQNIGLGMIGELVSPMSESAFFEHVKKTMNAQGIRHSALLNKPIKKVAVLGGSGSFAIKNAMQQEADVFLTADLKYHQFYEAENRMIVADIGHYESESYTKKYISDFLIKKLPNFAIVSSNVNTNPIKYL
ncbi:MAG: Nif3-like dinuclear metal center hexameric protein [Flavobacteriales bacterium]|nr:Nif3-like dinuclear metal center hexameric protein [Flavobacteriales bacterium]